MFLGLFLLTAVAVHGTPIQTPASQPELYPKNFENLATWMFNAFTTVLTKVDNQLFATILKLSCLFHTAKF